MPTSVANATSFPLVSAASTIAIGSALPAACIIVTALRFLIKYRQRKGLGPDDWCTLFALAMVIGMGVTLIYGAASHALGYPTPKKPAGLTPAESSVYVIPVVVIQHKVQYIFRIMMILAYGSVKASITFFYRRLFVTRKNTLFDIITKVTLVVIALWTLTFELIAIFDCGKQVDAHWNPAKSFSKYCSVLGRTSEKAIAISDLILDLIVILMPLPWVWRLKVSWGKRLAITGVFLLGASAVGASIARLIVYLQLVSASSRGIIPDTDLEATIFLFWAFLEAGLSLIAACLPTLSSLHTVRKLESMCNNMYTRVSSSFSSPRSSKIAESEPSRNSSEQGNMEKQNAWLSARSKEDPRFTQDSMNSNQV